MASTERNHYLTALIAGGMAGISVDISLFPLDTMKTRLQSEQGFRAAGGFRGIYSGLASVAAGSIPTAAMFFVTYEAVKKLLEKRLTESMQPVAHMSAASLGEVAACIVRVPVEVVKQRAQASPGLRPKKIISSTLGQEGLRGFYRGYLSTVMREVPFSFLQFPIWEFSKKYWSKRQGHRVDAWQSALCGAFAGGLSAGITTPLDVAKTRIMLAESGSALARGSIFFSLGVIYRDRGITGLFAGTLPRMLWISIGGAVFLGVYDKASAILLNWKQDPS